MTKWEYKVAEMGALRSTTLDQPVGADDILNNYGKDGWELVSFFPLPLRTPDSDRWFVAILKRPLPN